MSVIQATERERRTLVESLVQSFLSGENALYRRLGRKIPIQISTSDLASLTNRILREASPNEVEALMVRLLAKPNLHQHLSQDEHTLQEDGAASLTLHFRRFAYPYDAQWAAFYTQHRGLLLQGSLNQLNLKRTLEENGRIDVTFLMYGARTMRFSVLEAQPLSQKGFVMSRHAT